MTVLAAAGNVLSHTGLRLRARKDKVIGSAATGTRQETAGAPSGRSRRVRPTDGHPMCGRCCRRAARGLPPICRSEGDADREFRCGAVPAEDNGHHLVMQVARGHHQRRHPGERRVGPTGDARSAEVDVWLQARANAVGIPGIDPGEQALEHLLGACRSCDPPWASRPTRRRSMFTVVQPAYIGFR